MLDSKPTTDSVLVRYFLLIAVLAGLALTSLYSYLLFHTLSEIFSVVVAASVFIVAWAARRSLQNGYLLYIGIAFIFLGVINSIHLLAYKGMPVFIGYDTNLPTQLWIASRYLLAGIFLTAPSFLHRKINLTLVVIGFGVTCTLLVVSIFTGIFPDCYIDGVGLTPFKIYSEYLIAGLLAVGLAALRRNAASFAGDVLRWLTISIVLSIISGIAFTTYASVFSFSNLVGHLLKVASYYFLYRAIVETGLYRPFDILLRDLKQSETSLLQAQSGLEKRVEERTRQLAQANMDLRTEIVDRLKAEDALRESEARFRTIFEETSMGIIVVGMDGMIQSANHGMEVILACSREEIEGKHISDITYSEDAPASLSLLERLARGEVMSYDLEKRYITAQGEPVWTHLSISSVMNEDGTPKFYIGIIKDISEGRRVAAELREVQSRLMTSKEEERLSLARDLHDGPLQEVVAAAFMLNQARMDAAPEDQERLKEIYDQICRVNELLRAVTRELRPQALAPFGLEKAIRSLSDTVRLANPGLAIHLDLMPDGKEFPETTRMALYRVFSQALDNILQHSDATQASVLFQFDCDQIRLEITDNGCGFQPPASWIQFVRSGHFGLAGMSERVEALGGIFTIQSQPGIGTSLYVMVPRATKNLLNEQAARASAA